MSTYIYSKASRKKTLHTDSCKFASRIKNGNRGFYSTIQDAVANGCVPCARCLNMQNALFPENQPIIKDNNLHVQLCEDKVYIHSSVHKWVVTPSGNRKVYYLFHKNYADGRSCISNHFPKGYHRQFDKPMTVQDILKYILNHDRKAEKKGYVPVVKQVSKKEKAKAAATKKHKARNRSIYRTLCIIEKMSKK